MGGRGFLSCSQFFFLCSLLLLLFSCFGVHDVEGGQIGFCYGRNGDNLPSPQQVAQLLAKQGIRNVRLYDHDVSVLQAFASVGIDNVIVTVPNEDLPNFQSEAGATQWVSSYLLDSGTNITTAVSMGVEVISLRPDLAPLLLPAMNYMHTALTKAGLADSILVTTATSMAVLEESFPPSIAVFNASIATDFMKPILDFLKATGSFFMINAYPYHAYNDLLDDIALDYALFNPTQLVEDPNSKLQYSSLLDAQIDSVYYALEALGHGEINIIVSETGWPTKGDANEKGAAVQNAATYNNNLIARMLNDSGTPHHPGRSVDVYIFSLFNEDQKQGPTSERNWGVFNPDLTSVYYLDLTPKETSSTPSGFNGTTPTWCIAAPNAPNESLAEGINWVCGEGNVDCTPIQKDQSCFMPDTYQNHASYAYNIYYQRSGDNSAACNFSGSATITTTDPSYGSCKFIADAVPAAGGSSGVSFNSTISSAIRFSSSSTWKTMILIAAALTPLLLLLTDVPL